MRAIPTLMLAAAVAVGAAAAAMAQAAPPVKIGFIGPLTGAASDFGNSALLGAKLAVQEVNQVGGYLGRPLELVVRDDKGVPDQARRHAEQLVQQENVSFTLAAGSTGATMKMMEVFQHAGHVALVGMATGTGITAGPQHASFVFRVAPSDTLQAAFLVEEVLREGHTRVSVLADRTPYGEGGLKDVERFMEKKGVKPVHVGRFDTGGTSLVEQVAAAKNAGATALISYTVGPEHALIARARAQLKYRASQYTPWTGSSRVVWERGGKDANGLVVVQSIIQDLSNERRTSFIAKLHKLAAGQPVHSLMAAAQHYDTLHLGLRGFFQSKGSGGMALKRALENLERPYQGVVTTYEQPFSELDHDAFTQSMTWLGVWRDGQIHFLHATDARRASYVRRKQADLQTRP